LGRLRAQRAAARRISRPSNSTTHLLGSLSLRPRLKAGTWQFETRRLVALAEQDVRLYGGLLKLAKIERPLGKVASLDVVEAECQPERGRKPAPENAGSVQEARRNLEVLVGVIRPAPWRWTLARPNSAASPSGLARFLSSAGPISSRATPSTSGVRTLEAFQTCTLTEYHPYGGRRAA